MPSSCGAATFLGLTIRSRFGTYADARHHHARHSSRPGLRSIAWLEGRAASLIDLGRSSIGLLAYILWLTNWRNALKQGLEPIM